MEIESLRDAVEGSRRTTTSLTNLRMERDETDAFLSSKKERERDPEPKTRSREEVRCLRVRSFRSISCYATFRFLAGFLLLLRCLFLLFHRVGDPMEKGTYLPNWEKGEGIGRMGEDPLYKRERPMERQNERDTRRD